MAIVMPPEGSTERADSAAGRLTWLVAELVASHDADAGALFDRAAELVGRTLAGSCVIAVLIDGDAKIHPLGVFHDDDRRNAALQGSSDVTWSPVAGVAAGVLASGAPVLLGPADIRSAARFSPWAATLLDDERDSYGLVVVMRALGRHVGVMAVVRSNRGSGYDASEIRAVQLAGDTLGLAAQVIELSDDVERLAGSAVPIPLLDRRLAELSARQREILRAVERGLSSREIAEELHLSPRTVEWHRARIIAKLGTSSRAELVALARDLPS
jgi:DNA-binding CsgD family transcriptional regulator